MNPSLILVNYGVGNMASIRNALSAISCSFIEISHGPVDADQDSVFILPGVGSFHHASFELRRRQLYDSLTVPNVRILGICLGMQLLFCDSSEGTISDGLALIDGNIRPIIEHTSYHSHIKLPHIGWQPLQFHLNTNSSLRFLDIAKGQDFYFVHSYMAMNIPPEHNYASVSYGNINIPAIVLKDGCVGFQFHPEKSGRTGLSLLSNTVDYLMNYRPESST